MPRRYYSSTAARTTLSSGINSTATSITVGSVSGFPGSFPYTLILDQDTASEEVVNVTAASGTTLTVTRGQDGTTGVSHSSGAAVNHGVSARDFDEPNAHVNDTTTDVHSQYVLKSLLTAKAAIVTATAASTPAALTVGANDTVLTADSSTATGLKWAAVSSLPSQTGNTGKLLQTNGTSASWVDPPANRNLVINGAMQVHQRGTSVASVADGYATADRWRADKIAGTWTQSVENDAPTGSGLRKSFKMLCTTAKASLSAGDYINVQTDLEGQDVQRIKKGTSAAEQLSLSFWVKSNVTGTHIVQVLDRDNSRHVSAAYTVDVSGTWERKTITFPADTTGVLDNDNAGSLTVQYWLGAGTTYSSGTLATTWASTSSANRAVGQVNVAAATNNYWQITGVQLETGPVATPFEFEPYEATLRKCQRYYYRIGGNSAYQPIAPSQAQSGTQAFVQVHQPIAMRVAPTSIEYANLGLTNSTMNLLALTNLTIQYAGIQSTFLQATVSSGITAGNATFLAANNSTAAYLGLVAEL